MWSKLFNRERRRKPRYQLSLPATVVFLGEAAAGEQPLAVLGTTRDLSEDGLAVFVPSFPFSILELTATARELKVMLALPVGYVVAWAQVVRVEVLPAEHPQIGYLLAARIRDMPPADQAMYQTYIKQRAAV